MKTFRRSGSRGFTLLEVLLALAIFSLVVAAIYSTWIGISRGAKVGREVAAQAHRERVALRTLEEALGCIQSFQESIQYYSFVAESGSDGEISFTSRLPKSFPRGGRFGDLDVRRLNFKLEPGDGFEKNLVMRQSPIFMDFDEDEMEHPLVLAHDVKKMEFQFWDMRAGDWIDEWRETNNLPRLVKLTLTFKKIAKDGSFANQEDKIARVVALPANSVPAAWQRPRPPQQQQQQQNVTAQ
ncbi:MAG: prepilin-type N-terminal cleavage/methylation domain-containing protein [Verrucomicrobia bacterium]|nr:MAG: prepilin-type N-terminal cleavage/methylation domain-containing protein [Verrucomicrobiota bacterium]